MIVYFDTSMLVKLIVEDEADRPAAELLWLGADHVVCAEIGHVEVRAALAAAHRAHRIDAEAWEVAKGQFDLLWQQVSVVAVDTSLVFAAADIAERDGLRGYDAVHLAAASTTHAAVMASADRQLAQAARNRGLSATLPQ